MKTAKPKPLPAALAAAAAPSEPLPPPETPWFETVLLPIGKIKASPTNPRKHFDPTKQLELEASMRAHGFTMSTLLVRALPDGYFIEEDAEKNLFTLCRVASGGTDRGETFGSRKEAEQALAATDGSYELVAGERRWRAARSVGITQVPCIVRQLSDQQVLELQLVENVQRDDLTAIEEAEGLGRLLALRDADGRALHTCTTLAAKIGKSVRHVERRVKLVRLNGEARKAVEEGILPANTALLIARIPDEKLREKATKEILHPKHFAAPLSLRQSEELVQRDFMRDLRNATFDTKDPEIVPIRMEDGERVAGGACTDCPLRLGNATHLDPNDAIPSGMHQMCMNPRCFEEKKDAGWRKWQDEETDPAKKRKALSEDECKRLYRYGDQLEWNCGFVDLAERPDSSVLKPGTEASGTWRSMTKGSEIEVFVARDRNGKKHELVSVSLAIAAAEGNDHKIFKGEKKAAANASAAGTGPGLRPVPRMTDEQRRAADEERADSDEIEGAEEAVVAAEIAKPRAKLPPGFWPEVLQMMIEEYYGTAAERLEERRGWKSQSLQSEVKKLTENEQIGVISEFLFWSASVDTCGPDEAAFLKMFGIEAKPLRKAARTAVEATQKRRKELRADINRQAVNARLIGDGKLDALLAKNAKAIGLDAGAKFEDLRDVAALDKILDLLRKMVGAKGDEKLMAKARELRAGGKAKSVPELAAAMKIAPEIAAQLNDALIDEEYDAKAPPAEEAPGVKLGKPAVVKAAVRKALKGGAASRVATQTAALL